MTVSGLIDSKDEPVWRTKRNGANRRNGNEVISCVKI